MSYITTLFDHFVYHVNELWDWAKLTAGQTPFLLCLPQHADKVRVGALMLLKDTRSATSVYRSMIRVIAVGTRSELEKTYGWGSPKEASEPFYAENWGSDKPVIAVEVLAVFPKPVPASRLYSFIPRGFGFTVEKVSTDNWTASMEKLVTEMSA